MSKCSIAAVAATCLVSSGCSSNVPSIDLICEPATGGLPRFAITVIPDEKFARLHGTIEYPGGAIKEDKFSEFRDGEDSPVVKNIVFHSMNKTHDLDAQKWAEKFEKEKYNIPNAKQFVDVNKDRIRFGDVRENHTFSVIVDRSTGSMQMQPSGASFKCYPAAL